MKLIDLLARGQAYRDSTSIVEELAEVRSGRPLALEWSPNGPAEVR